MHVFVQFNCSCTGGQQWERLPRQLSSWEEVPLRSRLGIPNVSYSSHLPAGPMACVVLRPCAAALWMAIKWPSKASKSCLPKPCPVLLAAGRGLGRHVALVLLKG